MKLIHTTWAASILAVASVVAPSQANAQVAVDVDITVGSIVILYYHNNINVNLPDAVLASLFTPAGCAADPLVPGVGCLTAPPAPTDATSPGAGQLNWVGAVTGLPAPTNLTSIDLNLSNVWAVRAIGGASANTTVTIAGAAAGIAGNSGSIGIVSRAIATGPTAVCAGGTTSTFADPGLGAAQLGSVCLELDFTTAVAGPFDDTGDTGDTVYTLQVTGT